MFKFELINNSKKSFAMGTIACQVYSSNRKIIYAAWARNFSAVKPFFDA